MNNENNENNTNNTKQIPKNALSEAENPAIPERHRHRFRPDTPHCPKAEIARLKDMFDSADRQIPINKAYKDKTLQLLYQEARAGDNLPVQDKKLLLLNLIRYADRNLSVIHLVGCIVITLALLAVNLTTHNPQLTVLLSMIFPALLACISAFEVRQICFCGIAELGETCYFHVSQLAALSMALSGILDLMAVTAGILIVGLQWKVRLLHVGLYILVPYIFMQCICFRTLLTETGRKYSWFTAAVSIPPALCFVLILQNRILYTESALIFWGIALLTGMVILAMEIRTFFMKLEKGDILCIN